jgi:predicted phage tail protein
MPLSEQEQRLLDEMERHLLHNDADIVSAPSGDRTLSYRNLVYGAVLLLVGVGALVAGVALGSQFGAVISIVIGVVGFAAMVVGVILAVTPVRRTGGSVRTPSSASPKTPQNSSSFMDRMNDRWDRRQDGH